MGVAALSTPRLAAPAIWLRRGPMLGPHPRSISEVVASRASRPQDSIRAARFRHIGATARGARRAFKRLFRKPSAAVPNPAANLKLGRSLWLNREVESSVPLLERAITARSRLPKTQTPSSFRAAVPWSVQLAAVASSLLQD